MANQPAVQVEGLAEVRRGLKKLEDKAGRTMLKEAHKTLADKVAALATPNVPVGPTGRLKASVRGLGSVAAATGKAGGKKVPYAAAIIFGVGPRAGQRGPHNIKAQPFLFDALDRLEPDAADEYSRELQRLIDHLWEGF